MHSRPCVVNSERHRRFALLAIVTLRTVFERMGFESNGR